MSGPVRGLIGVLLLTIAAAGGYVLMREGVYGWTLFVVLPLFLGGLASWALRPETGARAAELGALTMVLAMVPLLGFGIEGLGCLVMVLPLTIPIGALGGWLVHAARQSRTASRGAAMLLLMPSASVTWDSTAKPPMFEVRTAIEIAATPETVWKHVVTFSELPEPKEWYFRTGLAYPMRASIAGAGPGAVRYCEFSTGPFVEPIEVWDEPRLLRFQVTENPAPMHEWSPYREVLPKHLHGYLVSKRGEFRLTPLANGHTRLDGRTWYQHGLWPSQYWHWWSDAIIHRIHLRVLRHIQTLAEGERS